MNGTRSQPDLNAKQRKKKDGTLTFPTHLQFTNIYSSSKAGNLQSGNILGRRLPKQMGTYGQVPHGREEEERRAGFPQFYNGNSDAARCR